MVEHAEISLFKETKQWYNFTSSFQLLQKFILCLHI